MKFSVALFDVDSTLTENEAIDLLAAHAGCGPLVKEITERAMKGEINFDTALRERVALLKGLPISVLDQVREEIAFSEGARFLIDQLKARGFTIGVVSGGFTEIVEPLFAGWPIDYLAANSLASDQGLLTGEISGEIVNREFKRRFLESITAMVGLEPERAIAVGDGANDIAMVTRAGLGFSYRGKEALNAVADVQINSLLEVLEYLD